MFIFNKVKYFIIGIMFFISISILSANFEITEIMYDVEGSDAKKEWIEVKNISENSEDLSKWFFFSDNTKHTLKPIGISNIKPGEYAVIVQNEINFKNDWSNYNGFIFDSSWTDFVNKGETIALKNPNLDIVSPVSFSSEMGGIGNGLSLQKIDGVWQESKPTPGVENKLVKTIVTPTKNTSVLETSISNNYKNENIIDKEDSIEKSSSIINLNDINFKNEKRSINIYNYLYPYIGLVLIIIIGIVSVIFLRKNQKKDSLEKGLSAEDIKIIE